MAERISFVELEDTIVAKTDKEVLESVKSLLKTLKSRKVIEIEPDED